MTEPNSPPADAGVPLSKLQQAFEAAGSSSPADRPAQSVHVAPCLREAQEYLKNTVTAVNVTDIQTAVMRLGSMAVCHMLLDAGIERSSRCHARPQPPGAPERPAVGLRRWASATCWP